MYEFKEGMTDAYDELLKLTKPDQISLGTTPQPVAVTTPRPVAVTTPRPVAVTTPRPVFVQTTATTTQTPAGGCTKPKTNN